VRENDGVAFALQLDQIFRQIDTRSTATDTEIYTSGYQWLISYLLMSLQTKQTHYRLGFVGAGKLAGSVIRGLVRARFCAPSEILASEPFAETREKLQRELNIDVTTENAEIAEKAEVILLGVKPGVVLDVISELAPLIADKQVVSLAAGVRIASMAAKANARFMRAMTNTPSAICRAASAIAPGANTTDTDRQRARNIFGAIGVVVEIDEEEIDAATALAGGGPAFVYTVIEALANGATKCGLPIDVALTVAAQTVLGASELTLESKLSPNELRAMVVTPGGTTAAGLAVMEKEGTAKSLSAAVEAAAKRGREMAEENL
jgi:pyrroline-5-carboxylate reductase